MPKRGGVLLGFKVRFVPFVEEGSKTHTIRADRARQPKPGDVCHCYTGLRQKGARLLGRWICTRVDDMLIEASYGPYDIPLWVRIRINGDQLSKSETSRLCYADGFRSDVEEHAWMEFAEYWRRENRKALGSDRTLRWKGKLITWDYRQPVEWPQQKQRRGRKLV
jgi:hypothetical protein